MGSAKFERDGLNLTRGLLDYVQSATVRETAVQEELRTYTAGLPESVMMSPPEQGQIMALLARMIRAERMVEVGVFTGYSATWLAGALPAHGKLVACDVDEHWMDVARGFWTRAGLSDRIDERVGPGAESLQRLLDEGWGGTVDLIFVDADKTGYSTYYELGLKLLRPGGIMLFDNVLWSGEVANPDNQEPNTEALREVVRMAGADSDVHAAVLTDADGLLLVMKPYEQQ